MAHNAFLFPGQGAQQIGMGQKLVERFTAARTLFDEAQEILGYDLLELCREGPEERLNSTVYSQPALFVTSLAALEGLRETDPAALEACQVAAGLSLGEYTALVFAGCMSFADGLRVVQKRGTAMQAAADATPSTMASILLLDREQVEQIVEQAAEGDRLQIANYLCPGNLVISGDTAACQRACQLAEEAGGRTVALAVAGAFHTDIMRPADEQLAAALADAELKPPRIPVISNVDAAVHTDPDEIRDILVAQVIRPVRWEDSIRVMLDQGVDQFYEIGPGRVLKGLLKRIHRKVPCESVNDATFAADS